jgi:hypothetical protein
MQGLIRIKGAYPDILVHDYGGYESRHQSTLALIQRTFQLHGAQMAGLHYNFIVASFDNPESCIELARYAPYILTYSVTDKCPPNIIAIPDFVFGGWPEAGIASYASCTTAITEAGKKPPQFDKLFWIGNSRVHESREELIRLSQRYPDDICAINMSWDRDEAEADGRHKASHYVSMPDHCAYGMLLDIRGMGYSGRLKLLFHANRPVFIAERPFREFYYDQLKPFENFVPVKSDLSDLVEKTRLVKNSPELTQKLAAGATLLAQNHLTQNCAINYMRQIFLKIGMID